MKNSLLKFLLLGGGLFLTMLFTTNADAANYTVCDSGCDFSYARDALQSGLVTGDIVTLTTGYSFNPVLENGSFGIPEDVTMQCDAGAGNFGDSSEARFSVFMENESTLQNCRLDNVGIYSYTKNNISILGNSFTGTINSDIVINNNENFKFNDNIDVNYVVIGASDDSEIKNNSFRCRDNNICLQVTGVGAVLDYDADSYVSNNLLIDGNTFNNYSTGSGDWISINAGRGITFSNNTLRSMVTIDNNFLAMSSMQNTDTNFLANTLIMPEKSGAADNGTWAINIRVGDADSTIIAKHNSVFFEDNTADNGSSCMGVFGDNSTPNTNINVNFNYNLCYNSANDAAGTGVNLNYDDSNTNLSLTNRYNGLFNISNAINDDTGNISALAATTVTSNPVLRRENVDTSDDYQLAPMSSYLDVDGTLDIGSTGGARVSSYTIDDDCLVDYVSCVSKLTTVLDSVLRNGDVVTLGAGDYESISLPSDLNNISITGAGSTSTVIDAGTQSKGLQLNNLSNSIIRDLGIKNTVTSQETYSLFSWAMRAGGNDYDDAGGPTALLVQGSACENTTPTNSPSLDVTGLTGIGTGDLGIYLVNTGPDGLVTVIVPNDIATDPNDIETKCGFPASLFEHFVTDAFQLQPNGDYVYNKTAMTAAGITPLGDMSDPFLNHVVDAPVGMHINNSSDNEFTNISFVNNTDDVWFVGTSGNNRFNTSSFSANVLDVVSTATATNKIIDSVINPTKSSVTGAGNVEVLYTTDVHVNDATDSSPLLAATVLVKNNSGTNVASLTTDVLGQASSLVLATILSNGVTPTITSGGQNPFHLVASADGYRSFNGSNISITSPYSTTISLSISSTTTPTSGTSAPLQDQCPNDPGFQASVIQCSKTIITSTLNPFGGTQTCSPSQIITQNLKAPARNGKYHSYTKAIVKEAKILQSHMNRLGFKSGPEDGIIGPLTDGAIKRMQKYLGTFQDGYVGPITRGLINNSCGEKS